MYCIVFIVGHVMLKSSQRLFDAHDQLYALLNEKKSPSMTQVNNGTQVICGISKTIQERGDKGTYLTLLMIYQAASD